jgi:membrane protein implicated in regulation of membrane protease activity
MTFVWLAVALAFAVAEMLTLAFYAVFLVIGGLAAAVAALLGVSQVGQVVVFCVVSIAGVLAARPPLMGYLNRNRPPETRSGAQAMIGQQAPVIEEIQPHQPGPHRRRELAGHFRGRQHHPRGQHRHGRRSPPGDPGGQLGPQRDSDADRPNRAHRVSRT